MERCLHLPSCLRICSYQYPIHIRNNRSTKRVGNKPSPPDQADNCLISFRVALTHRNLLNNGRLIGECMNLRFPEPEKGWMGERLCNVPPLYHCFGSE